MANGFINGLSDLWLRFFRDQDELKALYRATEQLVGQAYLDMLSDVLNVSIREAPLFNKEHFKLITIREDEVTYNAAIDRYVFNLPDSVKNFSYLYNKVLSPTTVLEKSLHFDVDVTGTEDELRFYDDPFDWGGTGSPLAGVPFRTVDVLQDDESTIAYTQLAFWVPDVEVDRYHMYLTYGYLLDRFEPSSEDYRGLIRGIMRYFVLGPTFAYMTSALNVICGLPLIRNDGEILQSVDVSDPDYQVVTTDQNSYTFGSTIPLREDVLDTDNWGTLELDAFEHLTEMFVPKDHVSDPTWWYGKAIPEELLPDESYSRRVMTTEVFENLINNPPGLVKIGDPGFFIGADDDGFVPDPADRPGLRHSFAFIVFERFLRHHVFWVDMDQDPILSGELPFSVATLAIKSVINTGKSAYTYLVEEPDFAFEDTLSIAADDASDLDIVVGVPLDDLITGFDNQLTIGLKSWEIGDYYKYGTTTMDIQNEGTTPKPAEPTPWTYCAIGGADPNHLSHELASGAANVSIHPTDSSKALVYNKSVPVFDAFDVGKYITVDGEETHHEVLEFVDSENVYVDSAGITTGIALSWSMWPVDNAQEGGGQVDWPVQIEIT